MITGIPNIDFAPPIAWQHRQEIQQSLFIAVTSGNLAKLKAALADGADPNQVMPDGNYPLHVASQKGYVGVVETLLQKDADPLVRNRKEQLPLDLALAVYQQNKLENWEDPQPEIVENAQIITNCLTFRAFQSAKIKTKIQNVFFEAVMEGDLAKAKMALRHGCQSNSRMPDGNFPLHVAAEKGRFDWIVFLTGRADDPFETNLQDQTPRDLAENAPRPFSSPSEAAKFQEIVGWLKFSEWNQRARLRAGRFDPSGSD